MLTIWTFWPVRGAWIIIPPPRYMATWWIELELLDDPQKSRSPGRSWLEEMWLVAWYWPTDQCGR